MKPARNKTWHARTLDQETETKQKNIRLRSRIMRRACSVCLHTTGMDDRTKTIKINDRNDDLLTTIIPTFYFGRRPAKNPVRGRPDGRQRTGDSAKRDRGRTTIATSSVHVCGLGSGLTSLLVMLLHTPSSCTPSS